jgi:gamma-glutamyltranspeptidase / glutathione hydrolase
MATRTSWMLDRTLATGERGVVEAKHPIAAEIGADVLRQEGNAIDAAVAVAFAIGVVEPFMSGLGGGGFMVIHVADKSETVVVDYSMVSPAFATEDMYTVIGGKDTGLFGWPAVEGDENLIGPKSVAVPGTVEGLALALERYGTMSLESVMAPAIRVAEEGFAANWHTVLHIALDLANLNKFPATQAVFAPGGTPPSPIFSPIIRQPDLAATMRTILAEGPRSFYEGGIARAIVNEIQQQGGILTEDDLRCYRARVIDPVHSSYRGLDVFGSPIASGGPTVAEILNLMEFADLEAMGHNSVQSLHHIAEACRQAFVDRFAYLADPEHVDVPAAALTSRDYARERFAEFREDQARDDANPGDRSRLGVSHNLSSSEPGFGGSRTTTTHISTMDAQGNAVSLTQTLLGGWGSRMVIPGTGVLLNNGMMWFDPEPGRPNSVGGSKRPLANMAPVLVNRDGRCLLAIGAMGGRRILSAVPQIISNVVDHGMDMQAAITAPRLDFSTRMLQISNRIDTSTLVQLRRMGHPVQAMEEDVLTFDFASPVGVHRSDYGITGGANPYYPAVAIGVD